MYDPDDELTETGLSFLLRHNQEASGSGHDDWILDPDDLPDETIGMLNALGSRLVGREDE